MSYIHLSNSWCRVKEAVYEKNKDKSSFTK